MHLQRIFLEADGDQQARHQRRTRLRVELLQLIELHVFRDLLDEVDRLQDLHLAGNGQFIEHRLGWRIRLLRSAKGGRAGFDEDTRLALIGGRHHAGDHEGGAAGQKRDGRDPALAPPYGCNKLCQIDIHIPVVNAIAVHVGSVTETNLGRSNIDGQFSRIVSLGGNTTVNLDESDKINRILQYSGPTVYRALTLTER